jgi:sugar lactone lactonase YvrE
MRRPLIRTAAVLLAALCAYLAFAPVPAEPVPWQPAPDPGYEGVYARNTRLAGLQRIDLHGAAGPEHIALGPDGLVYAAVDGGAILRMRLDGSGEEVWASSGGRVLGFDFDAGGRMIAADALRGLIAIEPAAPHRVRVLADHLADASPIVFADAVTVAPDGDIYFTDATRRYSPARHGGTFEASVLDFIEHLPTGRVLVYHPQDGRVEVVADGLSFANGIVMSADGNSLLVAETGNYRVWRIAASARGLDLAHGAPADGRARVLLDGLPGYPDNLMRGKDGRIWLGLPKPRTKQVDAMAGRPFMRKLALRLPRALWPVPPAYGHVIAFNEDGKVVADLQDPSGSYRETTGVLETGDRLYIQSLNAAAIGWLPKANAGL